LKHFFYPLILILFTCQCRHKEENIVTQFPGKPEVPSSIKKEHEYLLETIHQLTLSGDSTGHAAVKLYDLMVHHFKEEEEYVLPPLGLLPMLASEKLPAPGDDIIKLCGKLKSQLPHLNAEHQMIKAYMDELMQAAARENHPGIAAFEKELQKHANTEEEVFFPAAILIGEYLKLKSN
jgi:hypothetical protein